MNAWTTWLVKIFQTEGFQITIVSSVVLSAIFGICRKIYTNRHRIVLKAKKIRLFLFPIKFNVGIILKDDGGINLNTYSSEIKKEFSRLIDQGNLRRYIALKDISEIIEFKTKEDAEKFVTDKPLDLLIWGDFTSDLLQRDGVNITRLNLNFTYRYNRDKENKIKTILALDISSRLAIKNYWEIVSKDSARDVQLVSNNLFDTATYILALSLKFTGRFTKSLAVFETLYNKLTHSEDSFALYVIDHVIDCYQLLIVDDGVNRNNYKQALKYCKKYLQYKPDDFFALSNMALFEYRVGSKETAKELVLKLLKLYPNSLVVRVDVAFIRILQKNYNAAYKYYKDMSALPVSRVLPEFRPSDVAEFLLQEHDIKPDPAFLYGSGILSYYFGDKVLGTKNLQEFYFKSDSQIETYKKMRIHVKRLLKLEN